MRFTRTRITLFVGIVCALFASAIAGRGDGLYVPFSFPATSCSNQFIRSLAATGIGTCATVSLTADVTGTLPVANGGVDNTAWTSYTPTPTCQTGSGTLSSQGYYKVAGKTVDYSITVTVTTVSTCVGYIAITAPVGSILHNGIGACKEVSTTNKTGSAQQLGSSGTLMLILDYTGLTMAATGANIVCSGTYEQT